VPGDHIKVRAGPADPESRMGKTKGSTVLTPVKLLRGRKDEARAVLPAALHHYLEERIVVASWYPEDDVIGLVKACAAILPIPGDIYETMGAAGAKGHLQGIYAHLLGRDLAARAHTLWKTQHDSGELTVSAATADSATYTLSGWDHASREYCRLLGAYFVEVHRLEGSVEPSAVHPKCRASGGDACVWTVRWKPS
jgi:hypothetical protein